MWTSSRLLVAFAAVSALSSTGCEGPTGPQSGVPEPSAEPVADTGREVTSLADIFPEGLGRGLVIDSCGGCHAVACSAIGQRTEARWKTLESDHRDRVADMSNDDYVALFQYLSANFNSTVPEPNVPPQFLEGGCTPF